MADDQETAAQAVQSTPSAEGSESNLSEGSVQTQDLGEDTQTGAMSENQEQEGTSEVENTSQEESQEPGDQSGQKAKPTRFERRIDSLINKVKENANKAGQAQEQSFLQNGQPLLSQDGEPLFTQEELEEGIDPTVLNQRIQNTVQSAVQSALEAERTGQQVKQVNEQYVSAVREHEADLESVKNLDPELEAEAAREYNLINTQINPYTGEPMFVPAVKFSEIVAKIESRAKKYAEKMAQEIASGNEKFIQDVSSSQAVPSSGTGGGSRTINPDTTDFKEFEKAYSSK